MGWWNIPQLRPLPPEADAAAWTKRQLAFLEYMLRREQEADQLSLSSETDMRSAPGWIPKPKVTASSVAPPTGIWRHIFRK